LFEKSKCVNNVLSSFNVKQRLHMFVEFSGVARAFRQRKHQFECLVWKLKR